MTTQSPSIKQTSESVIKTNSVSTTKPSTTSTIAPQTSPVVVKALTPKSNNSRMYCRIKNGTKDKKECLCGTETLYCPVKYKCRDWEINMPKNKQKLSR